MNIDEQKFSIWKAIEQAKITFLDGINEFKKFIANFIGAKQSQETMTPPNVPAPNTIESVTKTLNSVSGEAPIAQEKIEKAIPNSNIEKAGKEQLPSQVADQVETKEVITNNMPSRQASELTLNITDKIDGCRGEIVSKEYLEALNTEKQQYLKEWIQKVKIRIQDVKIKTQQLPLKGDIKIKEIINEFQKEIDELSQIRNTLDCSDKNKDAILKIIVSLKETIKELELNVVEKVANEQSSIVEEPNPHVDALLNEMSIEELEDKLLNMPLDEIYKNEKEAIKKALAQIKLKVASEQPSIVEEPNQYQNYIKTLLEQNKGINRTEVLQEDINRLTYEIRPQFLHGSPERETVSTLIKFLEEAMVSEQPAPA